MNEAFFLVEIQDVETGEYIEEPGRRGKMIITALDRKRNPVSVLIPKISLNGPRNPAPAVEPSG